MAQESRVHEGMGARARCRARALARRAGLSPALMAGIAGTVLVVALVAIAGISFLLRQPAESFAIERGEAAVAEVGPVGEPVQDEDGNAANAAPTDETPTIVVHVDGMVANPGVYSLQGDALRMNDAVEAAGGLAEGSDTSRLNLAEPLTDGEKVHVPAVGETVATEGGNGSASSSGVVASSDGSVSSASADALVNINTATAAELTTLPGIGEATATEIIRDREANGAFTSTEDLMRVSGIGEKKFAKIKDKIRV